MMNPLNILLLSGLVLLSACEPLQIAAEKLMPKQQEDTTFFYPLSGKAEFGNALQTVYVPVYSNVFKSNGAAFNLAVTLSLRNTDLTRPITITSVRYYNTGGEMVEEYMNVAHVLTPMASSYFLVNQTDSRGGVGANFIVQWAADPAVNTPIFEAVMVGISGTHAIAFKSQGQVIQSQQ